MIHGQDNATFVNNKENARLHMHFEEAQYSKCYISFKVNASVVKVHLELGFKLEHFKRAQELQKEFSVKESPIN